MKSTIRGVTQLIDSNQTFFDSTTTCQHPCQITDKSYQIHSLYEHATLDDDASPPTPRTKKTNMHFEEKEDSDFDEMEWSI